ncbi:MAG: hypothetical protein J6B45_02845 [Clostridia bacterium]|nr:hypothetical protein [Clostridia bacterium]
MEEKDLKISEPEKDSKKEENQGVENESNAARRLRLLGGDEKERIHDEEAIISKGNFFSNLWYQHKWGIIIGSVLIFIGIYFIVMMVTQPKYDMYLSYAGPLYPDSETRIAIDEAFKSIARDYDKDGEIKINFAAITYQNEEQRKDTAEEMLNQYGTILHTSENANALTAIDSQILSGTVALYLIDETLYKERYKASMLDISEITEYELQGSAMAGESGVYFKELPFYEYMCKTEHGAALKNLPDDTVICMLPNLTTMDDTLFENSMSLFKSILEFGK